MIRRFRILMAQRKLAKLLRQRRSSFELIDYRKRREAALRGRRRVLT